MKLVTVFLSTICSGMIFAQIGQPIDPDQQTEQTTSDVHKCRDAQYRMIPDCNGTVYFDEDQKAVMHAKSGKAFTGSCKVCHMNGNLEMFLTYQGGKPIGQDTVYFENGQIQLIRSHDVQGTGKEDGSWKLYFETGGVKWEKNYVMGAEDGESRYYYPDSSLWKIETWSLGQMSGIKQEYYKNNTLKKEIMYQNGEWNGKYITYFESGLVESEQEYKMGKKVGLSRYYYDNGQLFYEENHENGCRDGEFKRFYPKENMRWTIENYQNDVRHGLFEEYYDNDKNTIKYRATYRKGMLMEEHFFDEFGDETAVPEKKDGMTIKKEEGEVDVSGWPENPSEEFLKEHQFKSMKDYQKARKNYIWYHEQKIKEQEKQAKEAGKGC
ncbi:MAG: toxin-antitoxin system YwqK family antitoxin [Crocinitomicaceae bacterium]|nr:toxin-antitoxin system YwqK family antitoxin [Crocinitomicaceae bacterium]